MTVESQSSGVSNSSSAHHPPMPDIVEEMPARFDLEKKDDGWTMTCSGDWTIAAVNDVDGGLGREFRLAMSFFHYTDVAMVLLTYFALVLLVDLAATVLRGLARS